MKNNCMMTEAGRFAKPFRHGADKTSGFMAIDRLPAPAIRRRGLVAGRWSMISPGAMMLHVDAGISKSCGAAC
jgi:hypothetical protein